MIERNVYPNRIRVVLAERQLTNRWLADKLGVTEVQPSMAQFIKISQLLKVELTSLLEKYDTDVE